MATKKEIDLALEIACDKLWMKPLPNGKCEDCLTMLECKKCWKNYLIERAEERYKKMKEGIKND